MRLSPERRPRPPRPDGNKQLVEPRTLLDGVSPLYKEKLKRRVEARTARSDGCWKWTGNGGISQDEYGYTYVHGRFTSAHRLAYAIFVEDFPIEMHVLHHCDNPSCVRPDHLFLGTNTDNCEDRARKLRGVRKLTVEEVEFIRESYREGFTQYELAEVLEITQSSVRDALVGATYKFLPHPESPLKKNNAKGERCRHTKLTTEQVKEIKSLLRRGTHCNRIAKRYDVYPSTIQSIKNGKTWRHVD